MIKFGLLLAPLAFTTIPVTISPETGQYTNSYAQTLITLFFVHYFYIVAGSFLLINVSEQFYIRQQWKQHRIVVILS